MKIRIISFFILAIFNYSVFAQEKITTLTFEGQPEEIKQQIVLFALSGDNAQARKTAVSLSRVNENLKKICSEEPVLKRIKEIKVDYIFRNINKIQVTEKNACYFLNMIESSTSKHDKKEEFINKCYQQVKIEPTFLEYCYDLASCFCLPCDCIGTIGGCSSTCNTRSNKQGTYSNRVSKKYGLNVVDKNQIARTKNYQNYESKRENAQCCFLPLLCCFVLKHGCNFCVDDRVARSIQKDTRPNL